MRSSSTPRSEGQSGDLACPSCALTTLPKEVPNAQPEMVEAVKKHILNMLHLKKRPEVTQPVPKAALLNAIRKLHVGKVGENGYVEIEDDIGRRAEMNELMEQTSEIITFAESGGRGRWGWGRVSLTVLGATSFFSSWKLPGRVISFLVMAVGGRRGGWGGGEDLAKVEMWLSFSGRWPALTCSTPRVTGRKLQGQPGARRSSVSGSLALPGRPGPSRLPEGGAYAGAGNAGEPRRLPDPI